MTSAAGSIGVAKVDCRSSINGTSVIAVVVAVWVGWTALLSAAMAAFAKHCFGKSSSKRLSVHRSKKHQAVLTRWFSAIHLKNLESTFWQAMHADSVEAFIYLTHACIWATKHQRQRGACRRHVSFTWDTSSIPIHFTSIKRVWVTDTKKLSHRQKGLVNNQGHNMHSFVNELRLGVNLSIIWSWTQLWEDMSSLRTTQDSQFHGWLGIELNFDKLATHWQLLKTQENGDDWDLKSSLRDQQLIDHHSRLKKMSMIGTWTHLWEISISLRTAEDSRKCQWLRLGLGHEKSATHWSPPKTQENVDDWDLDSPLRNQQLLDDTASFWAPSYRL